MTARAPIGIGLIGVGRHGIRYARHIVEDLPDATLAAVCRRRPEQRLDLPGLDRLCVYGDPGSLIRDPAVHAVAVVVPPIHVRAICLEAFRAGKPLLIEKPLAASLEDARAIVQAAGEAGVPLMTAQTLRFDPVIRELASRRASIKLSEQLLLTCHIDTPGRGADHAAGYGGRGALVEFGVHLFDAVRHVTGEEVRDVRCTMEPMPPHAPERAASVRLTTTGPTDCRIEIARVPTGRIGRAEWIGSEERVTADWVSRRMELRSSDGRTRQWTIPQSPTVLAALTAFLEAVRHRTPMPITGEDGCRAVEIAEACYRSAAGGGTSVTLPLPD